MSEAEVNAGSLPSGVRLRSLAAHTGPHGSALDLYDPSWGVHDQPLVYAHVFTVRPGTAKGWGRHERHDDRYALLVGSIEIALCDTRPESSVTEASSAASHHDSRPGIDRGSKR